MGLNQVVELLINEDASISRYHRAISLFEFQTAVYRPKAFQRFVKTQAALSAPTKILRTARIFAAIRILEKIEKDLKQKKNDRVISIQDLAADEAYRSIFDDVIASNGGWTRIRHSPSARNFDWGTHVKDRRKARAAARIVDFSYRFSEHKVSLQYPGRKNPGGVEAGRYVVRKAYGRHVSKSTIKTWWREYQCSSPFLYLLLKQGFDLKPPKVSSKYFLEVLLRQVDDVGALRRYFSAYQIVRSALLKLGYKKFPSLDLELGCSPLPQLDAPVFCPKIEAAFEDWLKAGDPDY